MGRDDRRGAAPSARMTSGPRSREAGANTRFRTEIRQSDADFVKFLLRSERFAPHRLTHANGCDSINPRANHRTAPPIAAR